MHFLPYHRRGHFQFGRFTSPKYFVLGLTDLAEEMHALLVVMTEEEAEQAIEAWGRLGWVQVVALKTRWS